MNSRLGEKYGKKWLFSSSDGSGSIKAAGCCKDGCPRRQGKSFPMFVMGRALCLDEGEQNNDFSLQQAAERMETLFVKSGTTTPFSSFLMAKLFSRSCKVGQGKFLAQVFQEQAGQA